MDDRNTKYFLERFASVLCLYRSSLITPKLLWNRVLSGLIFVTIKPRQGIGFF